MPPTHPRCAANWPAGADRIDRGSLLKQIPLAIGPLPQPTFDNFVAGANAAALLHLCRAAGTVTGTAASSASAPAMRAAVISAAPAAPEATCAPLYLWGPAGSGKTHLLRAWVGHCAASNRSAGWFDASTALPWSWETDWALVVIDRCEALDTAAQHAAFTLFVEAATHGVQVAAAGRMPPVDLPLREDLRSRLGWGHVFGLQPLGDDETRAAVVLEADRRGIFLSDELMDHVLTRFPRDLSQLMHLLDRLDRFALAHTRRVTVPLLRQMLLEEASGEVSAV